VIIREIFSDVLLALAAAIVLASSVGVLVMRGVYDKLHFVTPAALVAPVLVTLAVLLRAGFSATTTETCLALLFMVIAGPFLTHATIRAARVREKGDWRPGGEDGAVSAKGAASAKSAASTKSAASAKGRR
jgi:multicomponent Na+:H+ antiporter subunit G